MSFRLVILLVLVRIPALMLGAVRMVTFMMLMMVSFVVVILMAAKVFGEVRIFIVIMVVVMVTIVVVGFMMVSMVIAIVIVVFMVGFMMVSMVITIMVFVVVFMMGSMVVIIVICMMVSMVESIGGYYACAQLSCAPPPSGAAVVRGLASEGWGLILCGLFGTGNGTTSYGENIGAISITRVGSRAVVQTAACIMMVMGLFPKFAGIFVSMPAPLVGGLYSCMFGMIASSGLSLLQHADLSSQRNLFILGFCLYNGLALKGYFDGKKAQMDAGDASANPFGAEDEFFFTFFDNTMIISLLCGVILDNIIPGTKEERGMLAFSATNSIDIQKDEEFQSVYGLPRPLNKLLKNCVYLDFIFLGFKWPTKPDDGEYKPSTGDCCEMFCPCWCKPTPPPEDATPTSVDGAKYISSA